MNTGTRTRTMKSTAYRGQLRFAASVAAADTQGQRDVVQTEIGAFEAAMQTQRPTSANVGGGEAAGTTRALTARPPYPDTSDLLEEALRLQRAAEWLAGCDTATLRVLQRRVLCTHMAVFRDYGGIPRRLRPLSEQLPFPPPADGDEEDEEEAEGGGDGMPTQAPPLEPVSLQDFLLTYVVDDDAANVLTEASVALKKNRARAEEGGDAAAVPAIRRRSYLRPLLAAPPLVSAVPIDVTAAGSNLRAAESIVTVAEEEETAAGGGGPSLAELQEAEEEAKLAAVPARDDVLRAVAQWTFFFSTYFDKNSTGMCEDVVGLITAILLACGARGAAEEAATPAARADAAVAQLRATRTHPPGPCVACERRQGAHEAWCRSTIRGSYRQPDGPRTRFFFATAAVVLWAQTYLLAHHSGTAEGAATLSPAEVFLIRDWMRQAARAEARCLAEQAACTGPDSSTLRLRLSCATRTKFLAIHFAAPQIESATAAMTEWVESGLVEQQQPTAPALYRLLQEMLPVAAYYATFFRP